MALALAALEADGLSHPPLEVLLTVDEEAGMGGALGLAPGLLRGRYLINIDTEEWGHLYLGCAGGMDVNVTYPYSSEPAPAGWTVAKISLTGLSGGHSGIDIHKERGNAIKLLVRLLGELGQQLGAEAWRLLQLEGGTARNALPREAFATVILDPACLAEIEAALAAGAQALARELKGVEDGLSVRLSELPSLAGPAMAPAAQRQLLAALNAAPPRRRPHEHERARHRRDLQQPGGAQRRPTARPGPTSWCAPWWIPPPRPTPGASPTSSA